jgi:hypothetical protein
MYDDFGYDDYGHDDLQDFSDREAWEDAQADMRDHEPYPVDQEIADLRAEYLIYPDNEGFFWVENRDGTVLVGPFDFVEHAQDERDRILGICSCGQDFADERYDYYGIYAGRYCDSCFQRKYKQGPYMNEGY